MLYVTVGREGELVTTESSSNKNFIRGAAILAAAGIISRILGALYRIPLANLLGDEGIGLFELAQPLYNFFLTASTAGLPLAISKLVSEKTAVRDERGAMDVFKVALVFLLFTGVLSATVMFTTADWLAGNVYNDPRGALSIKAITPALIFVTVVSAFRGFFQGRQEMAPSAISQVLEQLFRVGSMLLLAMLLLPKGLEYAAAGTALGAGIGGFIGLGYLIIKFVPYVRNNRRKKAVAYGEYRTPWGQIIKSIFVISIPVALGASVLPIVRAIDSWIVPMRLAVAGFTGQEATALFGQLNGMAMPIVYFPNVITLAIASSVVPAISEAYVLKGKRKIVDKAREVIRVTAMIAVPAGIGILVMSSQICSFLYSKPEVGGVLASLSGAAIFLCILQTSAAILQGMGKVVLPVKNMIIGSLVKIAFEFTLTAIPSVNVVGAGISTSVGFAVVAILNMIDVRRHIDGDLNLMSSFLKPVISTAVMALLVMGSYPLFFKLFNRVSIATLAAIGIGVLVYLVLMLRIGGITEHDFGMIPKFGPKLVKLFKKMKLMR